MSKYLFKFVLNTNNSNNLIIGSLQLLKDGLVINEYKATSSYTGNQYDGSWNKTGGLIPPTNVLKERRGEKSYYEVDTTAIEMPYVKGVNGKFYKITPFACEMSNGVTRSDFGFHADKYNDSQGFPASMAKSGKGSFGCVVLQTGAGYAAVIRDMKRIKAEGYKTVELLVKYT